MTTQKIIEILESHSMTYIPQPLKEIIAADILKEINSEIKTPNSKEMRLDQAQPQEPEGDLERLRRTLLIFAIIGGLALVAIVILILTTKQ